RDVIEQAKTHCAVPLRMMPGRPHHRECAPAGTFEDVFNGAEGCTCGEQRHLVRLWRGEGIRVECGRPSRRFRDAGAIAAVVYPGELVLDRWPRSTDLAAALPEFGRDHLHHFGSLQPFRMARWIQMVGESVRRKDGETHSDAASPSGRRAKTILVQF